MASDFTAMRAAFAAFLPIPDAQWNDLCRRVRVRSCAKGELLLRQADRVDWLAYLDAGLLRMFCHTAAGETNLGFERECSFVGAYQAYVERAPAQCALQALEPSRLFVFDRHLLDAMMRAHPCWSELARRVAEAELARKIAADVEARTATPACRYAALLRQRSFLVRRVPQYHLASYLGIAPETLSRIRARRRAVAASRS